MFSVHGLPSACPHPRVLANLVSACLAAIHSLFDAQGPTGLSLLSALTEEPLLSSEREDDQASVDMEKLECFSAALEAM